MKVNCGTDIIEISRIKESIESAGEVFLNRVYTEKEIEYCESKKVQKYQSYAARFAAKEAIFKAISIQLDDKYSVCWKDIEILNGKQGRPIVNLYGIDMKNIESVDVSLSHCKDYAIAYATVVGD